MNDLPNSFWLLIESDKLNSYRLGDKLTLACNVWHSLPIDQLETVRKLRDSSQQPDSLISVSLHPANLLDNPIDVFARLSMTDQLSEQMSNSTVSNNIRIKLLNPLKSDFQVENWCFPTNQEITVSPEEYEKIQKAIKVQRPPAYLPRTRIEVIE